MTSAARPQTARRAALWALLALGAGAEAGAQALDEVIVTATKRAVDVQHVPLSVSAYSGEFIRDSGVGTLQDLSLYAPNFTFATSSQPTNARLMIRGIGSVGNNAIEPAVGVFVDGVYYPRPGAALGTLLDMQSVEVLRGPQGTLFGRNTAAGALNLSTRDPGEESEGYLEAGTGAYDALSFSAVASAPLTDALRGRIAVQNAARDGYGHNDYDGADIGARDELGLRGKLLFEPGERWQARLTVDFSDIEIAGSVIELDPASSSAAFNATLAALFGQHAETPDGYDYTVNQDHRDALTDRQWGSSIALDVAIGDLTLRSISAWREWQADTRESALRIPADVLPRNTAYDARTLSQEFQLRSPADAPLEYIVGAFIYDEDYDIAQDFDAGADACFPLVFAMAGAAAANACAAAPQEAAVSSTFLQTLASQALFAQLTLAVNERLSLTVGARHTAERKRASFEQTLPNPVLGGLFRVAESVPGLVADDAATTWLVNATLWPNDDVMLYASASTGFKGGGFNSEGAGTAQDAAARTFRAETSTNVELGVKSRLFDDRVTANVALYRTGLDDFQDRSFDGLSFRTRNAGSRTQQGIEVDAEWRPLEPLRLQGGISYLDAEFDEFAAASPLPGSDLPQDLGGQRPHYAPDWQGSLVADWRDRVGAAGLDWFVRGELQYVGEQNVGSNTNGNPQTLQDGYALLNLRTGIGGEHWRVTLYGRNLAARAYCQVYFEQPIGDAFGAVDAAANTSVQRCVLGDPRTYGATVRYEF